MRLLWKMRHLRPHMVPQPQRARLECGGVPGVWAPLGLSGRDKFSPGAAVFTGGTCASLVYIRKGFFIVRGCNKRLKFIIRCPHVYGLPKMAKNVNLISAVGMERQCSTGEQWRPGEAQLHSWSLGLPANSVLTLRLGQVVPLHPPRWSRDSPGAYLTVSPWKRNSVLSLLKHFTPAICGHFWASRL